MMTATTEDDVRRAIRDAMDRLVAGEPLYSDGKLTIKSLAEEAQIKRWLLTHRHTDLQAEFRARIANTDAPPALVALRDERDDAQRRIDELTADVTALQETVHQLERIIQVLALENDQLREGQHSGRVVPIGPRQGHPQ
ncbi:hypothetical protein [Rhodococcus coprophilus]|uniref:Uncharacterized protein n=2 Tax=Rhodococcus coprophilus TaxID=38310 RepID=A0A2X4U790_9NOCA|nr:hypothetical protein [Rhodococcus coprophilus]SQI28570.1 Uncharacterised protein [Rhodococcus coprophilus]